jgi:hypothetical protein
MAAMSEGAAPRRQIHGYVSKEARDGWYGFAERHYVNVTALLEAMGLRLAEVDEDGRLPTWLRQLVHEAREVAGARSSRRRTDD